jgi:hypothetical protein
MNSPIERVDIKMDHYDLYTLKIILEKFGFDWLTIEKYDGEKRTIEFDGLI